MDLLMLEAIRSDAFADDVSMPELSIASHWTEAQARAFFDSGGDMEAAAAAAPPSVSSNDISALADLLSQLGLGHLSSPLSADGLEMLWGVERANLLAHLKLRGVEKLSERQKLATAIAKAKSAASATQLSAS